MNVNELIKMLSELDEKIRELPILVHGYEDYELQIHCNKTGEAEILDLEGMGK